ncbi:MAG: phosphatidylglycerophosphatase A, partial [Kiritimatiellae bacterium]|nr:phosphatidylglycerophosphatase A [Kiritimatiellia bacterium]
QALACAALALAAVPLCGAAERALGAKDDGRIAADEWMLFPVALLGIPLASLPWWSMAVFFCVVRAVDVAKPWPCRGLQALPGGWGVVADDLVANAYSLAVNWTIASTML